MRARFLAAVALAVAGLVTISCGGIIDPSQNIVEPFSGTVGVGGSFGPIKFSASKTGEFIIKLTALAPTTGIVLGMQMFQGNSDGSCSNVLVQQSGFATLNVQALGGQIFSGRYCLTVFDVGALTAATTFTLTVSHP